MGLYNVSAFVLSVPCENVFLVFFSASPLVSMNNRSVVPRTEKCFFQTSSFLGYIEDYILYQVRSLETYYTFCDRNIGKFGAANIDLSSNSPVINASSATDMCEHDCKFVYRARRLIG